ncbi:non-ribosomal peptide synthetase [Pararhizobium mangrovi]|nr:non-ribosomal peptide synthetase [Pararhizobium mangrovi]
MTVEELTQSVDTCRSEAGILDRFEAQVRAAPEAVALVFEGAAITYSQLNRRANRLAHALIALGVGPRSVVALRLVRGPAMIVSIFAVIKAGAAYLPIDAACPADRAAFMIEDTGACVLIAEETSTGTLCLEGITQISPERGEDEERAAHDPSDVERTGPVSPDDLLYIIYTSGSTGHPKGVCVEHRNLARLFSAGPDWLRRGQGTTWAQLHSYCFDFSVLEIFSALLFGARLALFREAVVRSPADLVHALGDSGVTVLGQTPSAFYALMNAEVSGGHHLALDLIMLGGESLDRRRLVPWFERHGTRTRLLNIYGPTETTVFVTWTDVSADAPDGESIIGRPLADVHAIVTDEEGNPVASGESGELRVFGPCVTRGYLNRPQLTAERYVEAGEDGMRAYRTGDLVREKAGGDIVFLGRVDQQVKIRGHRVELGEIEHALLTHPAVWEAAVVLRTDAGDEPLLTAYIVATQDLNAAALRGHLARSLPDYMIPAAFVALERMPLNINRKLDRAALPAPRGHRLSARGEKVAPRTEVEKRLAAIWCAVLDLDDVGIDDGFVDLGGTSLMLARVHERMLAGWPSIRIADLFAHPTIRTLATHLNALGTMVRSTPSNGGARSEARAEALRRTRARIGGRTA